jgi:hypothetical protein
VKNEVESLGEQSSLMSYDTPEEKKEKRLWGWAVMQAVPQTGSIIKKTEIGQTRGAGRHRDQHSAFIQGRPGAGD